MVGHVLIFFVFVNVYVNKIHARKFLSTFLAAGADFFTGQWAGIFDAVKAHVPECRALSASCLALLVEVFFQ